MYQTAKIYRALLVTTLFCLGLSSRPAAALESNPGGSLFATGGAASVTVQQPDSDFTSELYLKNPDPNQPDIYLADSTQAGLTVRIPAYPAGTPLVFYIYVRNTRNIFYMGDGTNNADGIPHAAVTVTEPGRATLGFEDQFGGGDQDYNDNVFSFQGVDLARANVTTTDITTDLTPPSLDDCSVTPGVIWPPNHKMVDVTVRYTVSDNRDDVQNISTVLSVTSNEPDNGLGDGDTANDIEILDAHHIRVRAERSGKGAGRVYTIAITATDRSGNTTTETCQVTVPNDMRK